MSVSFHNRPVQTINNHSDTRLNPGLNLVDGIKKTLLKDFVYYRRNFFMSIELIITIDFCGNSTKRQRQPKMAKIVQLRGQIRKFTVAVGALFERGLTDNFQFFGGCLFEGAAFSRGANSRIYGNQC